MITQELISEIHNLAVEKGWWDNPPSFGEICALIHSELSEALDEYRNRKPMIYYNMESRCEIDCFYCKSIDGICEKKYCLHEFKPEGVAVELADAVIRALDWCGFRHLNIKMKDDIDIKDNFGDFIAECHFSISMLYNEYPSYEYVPDIIYGFISKIASWFTENSLDLEEIIKIKHDYNKTRPFRHGNKVL